MQFVYTCMRGKIATVTKQLTIAVALAVLPITMKLEKAHAESKAKPAKTPLPFTTDPESARMQAQAVSENLRAAASDPRTLRLRNFLGRLHCPVQNLAEDFVHAADDNHLDWRLLPSISVVESGGGKEYRNNNIFGWANGVAPFPTIRAGINHVAFKLGKSSPYENLDVAAKLQIYNPDTSYVTLVMNLMNRISPVVNVTPARRVIHRQNQFIYASD